MEILELVDNKIKRIENLDHLKNLRKLYLSNNKIKSFEGLENLINLETLDIRENEFSVYSMKREELAPYFKNLKKIQRFNYTPYPESKKYSIWR